MRWDYEKGYRAGQKEALETVLKMIENQKNKDELKDVEESVKFLMNIYENVHSMYSKNNPFR